MSFDTNNGLHTDGLTVEQARSLRRDFVLAHPTGGVTPVWLYEGNGEDGDLHENGQVIAIRPAAHAGVAGPSCAAIAAQWAHNGNVPLGKALTFQVATQQWQSLADAYALARSLGETGPLDYLIAAITAEPVEEVAADEEAPADVPVKAAKAKKGAH